MNILFPEQSVLTGGAFYRLYQPLLNLPDKVTDCQVLCVKPNAKTELSDESFNNMLFGADLFMTYFPGDPTESLEDLKGLEVYNKERIKHGRPGLKYVVDADDWFMECSPFNLSYVFTGTEEKVYTFTDDNGTVYEKAWFEGDKQKVNGHEVKYDMKRNKKLIEAKIQYLKMAHAVTTTTEALAKKLRQFNDNVFVLPNAIDFSLYTVKQRTEKELRIGYAYSGSHLIDWLDIMPVLKDFINKTPFVKLVLMGDQPELKGFELNKIEYHPYVNIMDGYHKEYSRLNCDIMLMPLFEDEFNACKSPLKWLEASAVKSASLAPGIVYGDYIKDGKTGMIYRSNEEFTEKLKLLVKNRELRETIAENAYKHVLGNYDINNTVLKYHETFQKIMSKGEKNEKNLAVAV